MPKRTQSTMVDKLAATARELVARLDRFEAYVVEFEAGERSNAKLAELKLRAEHVKPCLTQMEDVQVQIECQGDPLPSATVQEFVDKYFATIAMADSVLSESRSQVQLTGELVERRKSSVRLPKVELIKFNGDFRQWQTFIDLFNSLVHDRSDISEIEKFNYLIVSMTGEPLQLVKAIPLSGANYAIAYDTLVKRFSNKRLMATNYWHAIKSQPPMRGEDAKELRKLINVFAENLAVLQNLGLETSHWNFILVDLILEKLDNATRKRFELQVKGSEIPEFEMVRKFLEQQCSALEAIAATKDLKVNVQPVSITVKSAKPTRIQNHTSAFAVQERKICIVCNQDHSLTQCDKFLKLSPVNRHAKAKELQLCVNCLGFHFIKNCRSKFACKSCKKRHHTLLHFDSDVPVEAPEPSLNQIEPH